MPRPTVQQIATALRAVPGTQSRGESVLTEEELELCYQAFTASCGVGVAHQVAAWGLYLMYLADAGGARAYDPGNRRLVIHLPAGAPVVGAQIMTVITAIFAACNRYTHQRLMRSIPDEVAMAAAQLGRPTDWATKNGLAGLVEDKYGFPAAIRCTNITNANKLALSAASNQALPEARGEIINTGLDLAAQYAKSGALAANTPRLQITL